MCMVFGGLYLTLALGRLDETQWTAVNGGSALGKAMVTQELVTCGRVTLQVSGEHWSSINSSRDRGVNAALLEVRARLR